MQLAPTNRGARFALPSILHAASRPKKSSQRTALSARDTSTMQVSFIPYPPIQADELLSGARGHDLDGGKSTALIIAMQRWQRTGVARRRAAIAPSLR